MSSQKDNASRTISMVMLITLVGKVLGLLRDRMLAVHYGTGMEANAFYTASRIPRVFFDAIFASAIAACFIPIFSEYLSKKGKREAFSFANSFATLMLFITVLLCGVGMCFAEPLVALFASGYDNETTALTARLTQMMFPTVIFTGLAFTYVGILQSLGNFNIPALISTISNLVVIGYFLFFDTTYGIYGLAVAFLIGWLLQAVIQVPSLHRLGYHYRPAFDWHSDGICKVMALMLPVMVSTWVQPINLTINSNYGSHLYDGAGVSAIEISTNLYLIIAGVLVLSITNVIFPKLSKQAAEQDGDGFRDTLSTTIENTLFFILPMSFGLMIVSHPLVNFIYGGGEFDAFSVDITARALFWVSLGMVGFTIQNILSRAYFARQQGRIPLIAGGASIVVNLVLCQLLTGSYGISGLAIASAISSTLYALLLLLPLGRSGVHLASRSLAVSLCKMLIAALLMSVAAVSIRQLVTALIPDPNKLALLVILGATAIAGGIVYLIATILLDLSQGQLITSTIKRLLKRG